MSDKKCEALLSGQTDWILRCIKTYLDLFFYKRFLRVIHAHTIALSHNTLRFDDVYQINMTQTIDPYH